MATSIRVEHPYVPRANSYDLPPLPALGEMDEGPLYEAVGRAISAWETLERSLMILYTSLISPALHYLPLERAYGSVASSTGRLEMVRAAGEARFYRERNSSEEDEFRTLLKLVERFGARRNEIAHGVVKPYDTPAGPQHGVLVLPQDYSKTKHGLRDDIDPNVAWGARFIIPKYAYGVAEIMFFEQSFRELSRQIDMLGIRLGRVFQLG